MEEGLPGPSSIPPPNDADIKLNNNLDFEAHHLDPAYEQPVRRPGPGPRPRPRPHINPFYDSHNFLKFSSQNPETSKAKNKRNSTPELENEKRITTTTTTEEEDGMDGTFKSLPAKLHAVCLMALFHVNFVCGICNEALIDCICLDCGHNFCTLCIYQWFTFKRVCPTCYQFVKSDFGVQRTYCVDEFIAEMYTSVQELSQEYFGSANFLSAEHPSIPQILPSAADIEAALRNPRVLNPTSNAERQKLKQLRRAYISERFPARDRDDFSILEQQTELLGSSDSSSLSAVVQFFLSSITAYLTYEGSDSISSDWVLVGAISILVWYLSFITIMHLIGYDGSFSDLVSQLHFIEFFESDPEENESEGENTTGGSNQLSHNQLNSNNSSLDISSVQSAVTDPDIDINSTDSDPRFHFNFQINNNLSQSSGDVQYATPSAAEWETTTDDEGQLGQGSSRSQILSSGSASGSASRSSS